MRCLLWIDADNEAMPSTDSNTSLTESDEEKKTKGPVIFGYCLTDPQDLISIGLITVIAYNALDILFFYVGKLFNAANGAN